MKYLPLAEQFNQSHWIAAFKSKLALIAIGRGDISESLACIRSAREVVSGQTFSPDISRIIDEHELLVRVALVDNERISELLYRMPQTRTTSSFTTSYHAQRDPSNAQKILDAFPANNPREYLTKELISAQVFGENPARARQHLESAIDIAMKNGFKAIFGLQGARTQNYLLDIAAKHPTVYMEQLATMIRDKIKKTEHSSSSGGIPLTKRELDILRRLSTGLPIVQIAATLHISQNTIKTHLKNLYRKMKVESRDEAVTRGRELSLL